MDLQDILEAWTLRMTARTESCVGLVRSGDVTEGACAVGLHVVSIPCIAFVGGLVECGMDLNLN